MCVADNRDCGTSDKGIFITFEGGDGVGKSTHIGFLADVLRSHGLEVVCVREPGATPIGERLRAIVLDPDLDNMSFETELLIYEAARAQIIDQVILPALKRGAVVVCDRFSDSTIAYQHFGRGLDRDFVEAANAFSTKGVEPDKTILLTCTDRSEKKNRVDRRESFDRVESAGHDFHSDVASGFKILASENPDRIVEVETGRKHSDTAKAIFDAIGGYFPWLVDGSVDLSSMLDDFDEAHRH